MRFIVFFCMIIFSAVHCASNIKSEKVSLPPGVSSIAFKEIWVYLMKGEEKSLRIGPFTDICYFSARLDSRGGLVSPAPPRKYMAGRDIRWHLVVAELSNSSLLHFVLNSELGYRRKLVKNIAAAAGEYQGVQIDFEAVLPGDADNFHLFLKELKAELGGSKVLSVALPARRRHAGGAYDYKIISSIAHRLVIMAYDEHWSTSVPGPVASFSWCREVYAYARSIIPEQKLIMGIPLYGRAWHTASHSWALRNDNVDNILRKKGIRYEVKPGQGPYATYSENVTVKIFFDTLQTLLDRILIYESRGQSSIAFWRIGQEDPRLWNYLVAVKEGEGK